MVITELTPHQYADKHPHLNNPPTVGCHLSNLCATRILTTLCEEGHIPYATLENYYSIEGVVGTILMTIREAELFYFYLVERVAFVRETEVMREALVCAYGTGSSHFFIAPSRVTS